MNKAIENVIKVFAILALLFTITKIEFDLMNMSIVALALFAVTIIANKHIIKLLDNKKIVMLVVIVATLFKIYYIMRNNTIPVSDYATYYTTAIDLAQNKAITFPGYISVFPHVFGFPFILSLAYKLIGISVLKAQIVNLLFFLVTTALSYTIVKKIMGQRIANVVAILLCVTPSFISLSTVLCTEFVFGALAMLTLVLFIRNFKINEKEYSKKNYMAFIMLGMLFSISNSVRPIVIIILLSSLLFIVINTNFKIKRSIISSLVICLLIIIPYLSSSVVIHEYIGSRIKRDVRSQTGMLFTLNVGMNQKYDGGWNMDDAITLDNSGGYNIETSDDKVNKELRKSLITKIKNNNYIKLFDKKFDKMWGSDLYGYNNNKDGSKLAIEPKINRLLFEVTDIFYFISIVFALMFTITNYSKITKESFKFLLLIIYSAYIGMFFMVEAAQRYHYLALIIVLFLGANGAINYLEKIEKVKLNK